MKYFIILLILLVGFESYSQHNKSIGLRGGVTSGITFKSMIDESIGIELLLSHRNKGQVATALFEYHTPASYLFRDKLIYYYGFGAHAGYYKIEDCTFIKVDNKLEKICNTRSVPSVGFDAIVGVEYRLEAYPLTVGLDLKPFVSLFGPYSIWKNINDIAFTIKYNFN